MVTGSEVVTSQVRLADCPTSTSDGNSIATLFIADGVTVYGIVINNE